MNAPSLFMADFAEVYLYQLKPGESDLAAVREGEKREPDMLIYQVNEAHSYLFLGDMAKAKSIYLANRSRSDPTEGRTFPQIVLNDFRLMRAAGVTTPGMDEIETLMRAP